MTILLFCSYTYTNIAKRLCTEYTVDMKGRKHTLLSELQKRTREEDLTCSRFGRVGMMTVDHIVPMFFIDQIGLKEESAEHDWNFQFLCRVCNLLKRAGFDFTDKRTIVNLKRYVEIAEATYK